jgi:N-acetylornithine carbamoyltransferase
VARNLLSLADLPGDALPALLAEARRLDAEGPDPTRLAGKRVVLIFFNPSLRTRTSMELAAKTQGAHVVTLSPGTDAWKLETRIGVEMDGDAAEHAVEAVRVFAEMADLIGVRTFAGLRDVEEDRTEPVLGLVASESRVPVVNMESALDHPLQSLADLMTLQQELGEDLSGVPVALTWAPHPKPLPLAVAASFLRGASRMGMKLRVAAPWEFGLPEFLLDEARAHADVEVFTDQRAAVEGARAVYAKAWAAPGALGDTEAGAAARAGHADWTVTEHLLAHGDDAVFMHCLPVRRGVVVTDGVDG